MALMGTESASSSSATLGWKYDVFLSFRGTDTRTNFTDHLYAALKREGIFTFRDDEELEHGTIITSELLKAIEESRFAVVILSSDYASSRPCLTELAKIIECRKKTRLRVLPVFYHVDPRDVKNQRGTFAEAFAKHEERTKDNILDTWRAALTEVANLRGIHLKDQFESKVIEEIVAKISGKLTFTYSIVDKDLVGINSRMEELVNLLGMGLNDVRFIGIWGMGGIGKTTLARIVYNRFRDDFDGSSFLANVREESGKHGGLVSLQRQLLSDVLSQRSIDFPSDQWQLEMIIQGRLHHKRVLVLLDDVDQPDQLEALAGDQSWFGQGSRIIITTRDKHQLISHQVVEAQIYELKGLDNDESLKLFSRKAFKKDHPLKGYGELSEEFIRYAQGLPLALKVLGSFLIGRSLNLWESALHKFQENPPRNILDVLQISFDGLEEREKNIFLDIACFFKGEGESRVTNILQTLYDKPDIDIDVLLKKSLVTISWGRFQMHDLLQELGKEIVRGDPPKEAGERSRLWHTEDVLHVLKDITGTKLVKGIFLNSPLEEEMLLNAEAFSEMKNLRLLKINNVKLPEGLNYLSSELRFIHWDGYPLASIPTSFELKKLVELHMHCSLIKQLWKGIKGFKSAIIPGSEIPIWFSHQSVGSSVNLPIPSDFLCNTSTGFVVCAVFVLREHHPFNGHYDDPYWIDCYLNQSSSDYYTYFYEDFGKIESDHLWLRYFLPHEFNEACKEALSRSDANGFIQINFETEGPGLEVTKCGAHLVYNGRCVITPYEDDLDDSAKDTKIQQSRDDYVGDELAGFSGEAGTSKSNDVDVPHRKRISFPNLIEGLVLCFGNWIGNLCTQGQGDSDCEEEE